MITTEEEEYEQIRYEAETLAEKSLDNSRGQEILLKLLPEISTKMGQLHNQKAEHRRISMSREERRAYFDYMMPHDRSLEHCRDCAEATQEQFRLRDQRSGLYNELSRLIAYGTCEGDRFDDNDGNVFVDKTLVRLARSKLKRMLKEREEGEKK
jgi:hypothetical protein